MCPSDPEYNNNDADFNNGDNLINNNPVTNNKSNFSQKTRSLEEGGTGG